MAIKIRSNIVPYIIICVILASILAFIIFNRINGLIYSENTDNIINTKSLLSRISAQQIRNSVVINQSILLDYRTYEHKRLISKMIDNTKKKYKSKLAEQNKKQENGWKSRPQAQNITQQQVRSAIDFLNLKDQPQNQKLFNQNRQYYAKKYKLSDQDTTSPLCVVISSHNNQETIINLLKTISYQSFKNYHVILANSDSSDMTISKTKQFFKDYQSIQIDYVQQKYRGKSVRQGILNHCEENETVILLDANHEIIGSQVFKLLSVLSSQGLWLIYTNYLTQDHKYGNSMPIKSELFQGSRKKIYRMGGIRAFKAKMFHNIRIDDLKNQDGQEINQGYLQVIEYPLLEMAGIQRIKYLNEICYFEHDPVYQDEDQKVLVKQNIEYLKDCIMEYQRYKVLDDYL